jgi:outer membrane lipoprotein SlyB
MSTVTPMLELEPDPPLFAADGTGAGTGAGPGAGTGAGVVDAGTSCSHALDTFAIGANPRRQRQTNPGAVPSPPSQNVDTVSQPSVPKSHREYVGAAVGVAVGLLLGAIVGYVVGCAVGTIVGAAVGSSVGDNVLQLMSTWYAPKLDANPWITNQYLGSCAFVYAKVSVNTLRARMKVRCTDDKSDTRVEPHALLLLAASTTLALENGVSLAKNSAHNHVAVYIQVVVGGLVATYEPAGNKTVIVP